MRKSSILAICFLLLFAATARAELKIAVFDLQVVAEKSDALKEAQVKWSETYDAEKKLLEKQRTELSKKFESLKKPTEAQQNDLRKAERDFNDKANALMQKMQKSEQVIRVEMDKLILKAAADYAAAKGYTVIMDVKGVPYFDKSMEVTEDMLKETNRVWAEAKPKPKQ